MREALLFLTAEVDKVEDVTCLCGESIDRNKLFGLLSESPGRNSLVKLS